MDLGASHDTGLDGRTGSITSLIIKEVIIMRQLVLKDLLRNLFACNLVKMRPSINVLFVYPLESGMR